MRLVFLAAFGVLWSGCSSKNDSAVDDAHEHEEHEDHDGHQDHDGHADGDHDSDHDADHGGSDTAHGDGHGGGHGDAPPAKEEALPDKLSETGLYSDIISKTIAS